MNNFWENKDYHIMGSRGCGKTASLLRAAQNRGIKNIIIFDEKVGKEKEKELGYLEGTFNFISYKNFNPLNLDDFLIDEIDNFLHYLFRGYRGFTMSLQEY